MSKSLNVYTGSEVILCAPTHPYEAVRAAERMVEKIFASSDKQFQVNTNSIEAITMLNMLCPKYGIAVNFHINGSPVSYDEVVVDFNRGQSYISNYQNKLQL